MAGDNAQARTIRRVISQGEIRFAGQDSICNLIEWQHAQPHMNAGMLIENAAEKPRQWARREAIHSRDSNLATGKAFECSNLRFGALVTLQSIADMRNQHLACRRQSQTPRHSFEN